MSPDKWDIEKIIAMCVQEEDRMKASNGGSINYVKNNRKRNYQNNNQGSPSKPYGKSPQQYHQLTLPVDKDQCLYCKKTGHYKKDCPEWLKSIMAKKGIDTVSFVNESLYSQFSKSTWWIDSGATVYVANSLQGFHSTRTMQKTKDALKLRMEFKQTLKLLATSPWS
jgi:hypothetical protein